MVFLLISNDVCQVLDYVHKFLSSKFCLYIKICCLMGNSFVISVNEFPEFTCGGLVHIVMLPVWNLANQVAQ